MPNQVAMKAEEGDIWIEAEFSQAELQEIGVMDKALKRIGVKSLAETIRKCSADLAVIFDEQHPISKSMTSAEIEFGIKVSGEGNVYVAKATGEANITVKLKWEFNQE